MSRTDALYYFDKISPATNNVDYVPSDDFDNDIVTENIEVQEDNDSQTPQSSNIKKALMINLLAKQKEGLFIKDQSL